MTEFSILSNGRIERSAVYVNGEQLRGVKEILLSLDENGTFDAILQYVGVDGLLYTRQMFNEYLDSVQTTEPTFSEEEASRMRLLTVQSDGDIGSTVVFLDNEEQMGIVSLYVHMKSPTHTSGGLRAFFSGKKDIPERAEFKAEITYRNDDDSLSSEELY
ncbi:MAG: hypothetical protein JSS89_08760 [Bacteroidetes bacterium]|nr:hypothetical protein [Bacteroidota bacterium]